MVFFNKRVHTKIKLKFPLKLLYELQVLKFEMSLKFN